MTRKRTNRSNTGRAWEVQLEAQHEVYRKASRALIFKAEPRMQAGRYVEKAPPDYVGTLLGGRGVVFDAKCYTGGRFPFSGLARHQAIALKRTADLGGLAFVALRLGTPGESYMLPWGILSRVYADWREGRPGAVASVDAAWCKAHGIPFDGADWLGAFGG